MAKSRYQIEMDFSRAIQQADKLRALGENLYSLSNDKLNGTLQNISINWTGKNSQDFCTKGNILKDKMNGSAQELVNISEDIRRVATVIYRAEMAALEIAGTE